jgi:homopolymeric O-antigen transport system permease protein
MGRQKAVSAGCPSRQTRGTGARHPMTRHPDTPVDEHWDLVLEPRVGWFDINVLELWRARDLVLLFVKRDFVTFYKQTVLGPLWYLIQPLILTAIFTVIFGRFAGLSTDGIPRMLFYMSGTVVWRYFSECLNKTGMTFTANADIFGKVYFPRLTIPISVVITNFLQFAIQFSLFTAFYVYFVFHGMSVHIGYTALYLPMILFQMALLGVGAGILISSLTTKYRDLLFALPLVVQIWMYLTPVVYPLSMVPEEYRLIYCLNPMVAVVECFRLIFLGTSAISLTQVLTSWAVTMTILFFGIVLFSRIERSFMDTI